MNSLFHIQTELLYTQKEDQPKENSPIHTVDLLKWLNALLSNTKSRSIAINNLYDTIMESESFSGSWRYILMPLKVFFYP